MTPYLDVGFSLTLLLPTDGSPIANQLLRRLPSPPALNYLHQLQAESFLLTLQRSDAPTRQKAGHNAQRLWRYLFAEGVFRLAPLDWDQAFRLAVTWNVQHTGVPPPPLLVLHPALAFVGGATSFLSFDPRSRAVARAAGLQLLPQNL
jgi:hypothetical protein